MTLTLRLKIMRQLKYHFQYPIDFQIGIFIPIINLIIVQMWGYALE